MACVNLNCNCKCLCNIIAIIASIVVGIVTAFLQITGVITITNTFLWVVFGIAVGYLAVLLFGAAFARNTDCRCVCNSLNTAIVGILGAILFSTVLLAVGIVATSVTTAILGGLVLVFFSLVISGTACLVRCIASCCGE